MDWKACKRNRLVKAIKVDDPLMRSLLTGSENKLKSNSMLPINETTASTKVTLAYDALRELLEALAIKQGFKIYNHECYCAFLKEVIGKDVLAEKFDSYRKIRNAINYYGKNIGAEEAKPIIEEIIDLTGEVRKILLSGGRI